MGRPVAKDHDAKRARILKTAARVFAQAGVARASMAQIAAACHISKANIYHYYDSKDALLFDMLDRYLRALRDRLRALPLDGLPPQAQFRALVVDILLAYQGMDDEHKIQTEGIPLLPPAQRDILKGYQRDMVTRMGDSIKAVAPRTYGDDPRKLRATVMSVFGMLNWFYMWNRDASDAARAQYGMLVTDLVLNGITGRNRSPHGH